MNSNLTEKKLGRPKKENSLNEVVTFKVSSANKLYYKRLADAKGISLGEFFRSGVEGHYGSVSDFGNLKELDIKIK